jgi:hypothetical protein
VGTVSPAAVRGRSAAVAVGMRVRRVSRATGKRRRAGRRVRSAARCGLPGDHEAGRIRAQSRYVRLVLVGRWENAGAVRRAPGDTAPACVPGWRLAVQPSPPQTVPAGCRVVQLTHGAGSLGGTRATVLGCGGQGRWMPSRVPRRNGSANLASTATLCSSTATPCSASS